MLWARARRAIHAVRAVRSVRHADPAFTFIAVGIGIACAGWASRTTDVSVAGVLLALVAALLLVWGRESLRGVTYVRTLGQQRATFGERVAMDVELVNDKVLPLTWLHVREGVPPPLRIEGGAVVPTGWRSELRFVVAMLPYQRVRRHLSVICVQRGEHVFGPAQVRSGSPLGTHERTVEVRNSATLLVYPKVVPLSAPLLASRVPIGERRARRSLVVDPTRIAGVRPYQPGEPARHIDWRATARSTGLLVRVHEPATALGVAVFMNLTPAPGSKIREATDMVELTISTTASVVSHLLGDSIPTGLYANGTVWGRPVASSPTSGPRALPAMLEILARLTGVGGGTIDDVLLRQAGRLRAGVSVMVVSSHFAPPLHAAVAGTGRAATALWIGTDHGYPPDKRIFDATWEVSYDDDWRDRTYLDVGR